MTRVIHVEAFEELMALGFLRYGPQCLPAQMKKQADRYGLLEVHETGRHYYLDAEELAEGSCDRALQNLKAVLSANNVNIGTPSLRYDAVKDATVLDIHGEPWTLCEWAEPPEDTWRFFSRKFFSIVNALLARAGSQERLYALWAYQNEQVGVFLDPPLLAALGALAHADSLEIIEDPVQPSRTDR